MTLRRTLLAVPMLAITALAQAQAEAPAAAVERKELEQVKLEPLQGAWDVEGQRSAAERWDAIRQQRPADADAQYNYFKATRNARMATNNGRLTSTDKAELQEVAGTLERNAPASFESCMANYQVTFPDRAAFTELGKAYGREPERVELISPMLGRAMLDGDRTELVRWSRALRTRSGLSPALTDVAIDLLQSVDANGIVFTNGDMDTHPAVAVQQVDGLRPDVLVVDQRLLADVAYRQRVWQEAGASGQAPGAGPQYALDLSDRTTRPVFLALSIDPAWTKALRGKLYATGLSFRLSGRPVDNVPQLEQRWPLLRKPTGAGPLSRNYLLPGSILLQHYRSIGDEAGTARTEYELRRFSDAIGATGDLYKAGILTH